MSEEGGEEEASVAGYKHSQRRPSHPGQRELFGGSESGLGEGGRAGGRAGGREGGREGEREGGREGG
jgi:hypothetical protein